MHYQLIITSSTRSRVWAEDTLEQAETRLHYMTRFYAITHDITEVTPHQVKAYGPDGTTVIEIIPVKEGEHIS